MTEDQRHRWIPWIWLGLALAVAVIVGLTEQVAQALW